MRVCGKFESRYCLTALLFFGLLPAAYSAQLRSGTNIHIAKYEPALAIRASGCITCHAKVRGAFITDFGHGDRYFFGNHGADSSLGPFTGSIYGDFYGGEPNKTGWLTAEITNSIIVPQAGINFNLAAAGNKLAKSNYEKALQAASLAKYLQSLESQKSKPAAILERKKVFIGAPGAATLEARFHIAHASGIQSKYIKSSSDSPSLSGIELASGKEYYTNVRDIVCDGDLFIRGSLFLNGASIATKTGCRIYATGPVFLQNKITFKNLGGLEDRTNLQLASSEAILLGVGDKSCDPSSKESPLSRRLVSGYAISTFATRDAGSRSLSPKAFGQSIYARGKQIPQLEDAGCQDDSLGFSRLLLNAPQVHSRYKGKFKGLVIAEIALFRPGMGLFEFDPVFKSVPVLPRLKDSDYLQIQ